MTIVRLVRLGQKMALLHEGLHQVVISRQLGLALTNGCGCRCSAHPVAEAMQRCSLQLV